MPNRSGFSFINKTQWHVILFLLTCCAMASPSAYSGPREQALRMHNRLAGVPPSESTLTQMAELVAQGDAEQAAAIAMQHPAFYNHSLRIWITPWTNEEFDPFAPLNDYTATVIGLIRDDADFRELLTGDVLYVADPALGLPSYSTQNNAHYQAMMDNGVDLSAHLVPRTQSAVTGLPASATAGVMTTRAAAKAFFKDGTNRAMLRFTFINHMCTDMEGVADTTRPPDRIRQDVSRSPGGDSRVFHNNCVSCHAGMDPLAQAFAYYNYQYDPNSDPDGERGSISYAPTVNAKYLINANTFSPGYITEDDGWENYWRQGPNAHLGWSPTMTGKGFGAKSLGEELANSQQFAQCQATKVFQDVCLRSPQDAQDQQEITRLTERFQSEGYRLKPVFAQAANYCKGE